MAGRNEDVWNDLIREIGQRRDGVGMGIDPGIRDVVAGLWGHDIWTTASCQGHDDRGCPMPWVEIEGPWPAPSIRGLGIEERERWRTVSLRLQIRTSELLVAYYRERRWIWGVSLTMKPRGMWGAARLETCGMNEPDLGPDHLSAGTAELARADMASFGELLKARVLAGETTS